ncbi:DeoR family transcriptional regulator [Virgibacillus indicus]|uniref:DeoR family transcriptional regulator n=1 Tax=Virgibacillus indicus TaxID=2024554 RepID=UPI00198184D4|nr:DeoR family transcriptional regulator [Virgibacillus indicus]
MLPPERQNRIRELILERHYLKISELSKEIGVSEMTIHRDLKALLNEGIVIKTFGGVMLANNNTSKNAVSDECIICSRKVNERLTYQLFLPNNIREIACCAHCGLLRTRQLGDKVVQAICSDFLRHTTISAALAWYVMDTSIQLGCCHPQVLTFEWKEHADKFVKGFGGNVYGFNEAMEVIFHKMNGNAHCCSKHNNGGI